MNILQIFPGKIWGGAEQFILELGETLSERGHHVQYVAYDSKPVRERLEKGGINATMISGGWKYRNKAKQEIQRLIEWADVVHIHDSKFVAPIVNMAKKSQKQPKVVFTRHISRGSKVMPWLRKHYRHLHKITFVSALGRRLWAGANPWMPQERQVSIINGITPKPAAPAKNLREQYQIPEHTAVMVFTGRVRRSKGCEIIIEALGKIADRDFMMVFIGACKPADYIDKTLKPLAQKCGVDDKVKFYGFSDRVRSLLDGADIGVAPSIVREGCPLSPLEYMQQGMAVVTSDNGGQVEYITDMQTGLLVPPADADSLSERLAYLLDNPEARRRMGQAAKASFAADLSYDTFIEKITKAYQ